MAIDSIENNELGALAPNRLGMKQFADDYANYTGSEEFYNLFGSRKRKKAAFRNETEAKYADLQTDCANIQDSIDLVNSDLQTLLKRKSTLEIKTKIDQTNVVLGELQALQITQKCEKGKKEAEREASKKETLENLQQISESQLAAAKQEITGTEGTGASAPLSTKTLLIYGGIGVALLLGLSMFLRRKKA